MTHVVDGGGGDIIEDWRELAGNNGFWSFLGRRQEVIWRVKRRSRPHGSYHISREGRLNDRLTEEGHERFSIS